MKTRQSGFMLAALLSLANIPTDAEIQIREAWVSKPLSERSTSVVAFATITNPGDTPVTIIGASSQYAKSVQLHRIVHEEGIVRMQSVPTITIAPGGELRLSADGVHLMLMGLEKSLWEASHLRIQLQLDTGDGVSETFELRGYR